MVNCYSYHSVTDIIHTLRPYSPVHCETTKEGQNQKLQHAECVRRKETLNEDEDATNARIPQKINEKYECNTY